MLINKKAIKLHVLELAKARFGDKFSRVSKDVYEGAEGAMRSWCNDFVKSHPTLGKTLTTGAKKYGIEESTQG